MPQPRAPYPGMRPFLDYEDMLLHGRDQQIEDVIQRLGSVMPVSGNRDAAPARMRFVAVVGGSGSGKSSLIRAGVVPRLRHLGLEDAGDLWEAVVCTPGSNLSQEDGASRSETPIMRLAREFEAVLRPPAGAPADDPAAVAARRAERREVIAELLRQPGGLDSVVDTYGPDLDLADSVEAGSACVLIVIDQFEELFHRSNRDQPDVSTLIDRVIDHYHQARQGEGSPRCFVAITMRSEHLQDCAAFIGLPEAINAGSYLIGRLDEVDLRQVIREPARRYLRLRQRLDRGRRDVPQSVTFKSEVVERLVADALKIKENPDHLPLLQHALARLWQEACRREGIGLDGVPATIEMMDLWAAAHLPAPDPSIRPEDAYADRNLLEWSLQAWAQHEYEQHPPAERKLLSDLLSSLAYKDGWTGTYNQQRFVVKEHPLGAERLKALLNDRWIHSVNYLYWDDRNPDAVTLKVSHESLIRGWKHFRDLIDAEAQRLSSFRRLLEDCRGWLAEKDRWHRRHYLLDSGQLQRLKAAGVKEALGISTRGLDPQGPGGLWQKWCGWLSRTSQGAPLASVSLEDARSFYRSSENAARIRTGLVRAVWGLLVLIAVLFVFSWRVQQPVIDNTLMMIAAADAANAIKLPLEPTAIGGGATELQRMLDAVATFQDAETDTGWGFQELSQLLPLASRTVEPRLNSNLRAILTQGLWSVESPADEKVIRRLPLEPVRPVSGVTCGRIPGTFVPAEPGGSSPQRGIFVPDEAVDENGSGVAAVRGSGALWQAIRDDKACTRNREILTLPPRESRPSVVFDVGLQHLFLVTDGDRHQVSRVTASRVRWDVRDGLSASVEPGFAVVYGSEGAGAAVREQGKESQSKVVETWQVQGGQLMKISSQYWRIVSSDPTPLVPSPEVDDLTSLPSTGEACRAVDLTVKDEQRLRDLRAPKALKTVASYGGQVAQGTEVVTYEHPTLQRYCLLVKRSPLDGDNPRLGQLEVYAKPVSADIDGRTDRLKHAPVPVAAIALGFLPAGQVTWRTGKAGHPYEGWLAFDRAGKGSREPEYVGVPWSTDALRALGAQIIRNQCRVSAAAGGSPAAQSVCARESKGGLS